MVPKVRKGLPYLYMILHVFYCIYDKYGPCFLLYLNINIKICRSAFTVTVTGINMLKYDKYVKYSIYIGRNTKF